jgi:hypothetical protein
VPDELPEPFAPTGPKLSRFPIRPASPIRPHLFPDEARFAARLALLGGGADLAAWAWLARLASERAFWAAAVWGLLRAARPLWARAGTRVSRVGVAVALLAIAVLVQGYALVALGAPSWFAALAAALPSLGDLCSSCAADTITLERRPAAYSWIDVGQGLGTALGLAVGVWAPRFAPVAAATAFVVGSVGVLDLRDRGTPRSTWPARLRAEVARSPLGARLGALAFATGALGIAAAVWRPRSSVGWIAALAPLAGMALAARAEAFARNAATVPAGTVALAAAAVALRWTGAAPQLALLLGLLAVGGAATALPAAVARGAGEMERPVASSLIWSALALGAGLACAAAAWYRF